jgi:hypothetical protein
VSVRDKKNDAGVIVCSESDEPISNPNRCYCCEWDNDGPEGYEAGEIDTRPYPVPGHGNVYLCRVCACYLASLFARGLEEEVRALGWFIHRVLGDQERVSRTLVRIEHDILKLRMGENE